MTSKETPSLWARIFGRSEIDPEGNKWLLFFGNTWRKRAGSEEWLLMND